MHKPQIKNTGLAANAAHDAATERILEIEARVSELDVERRRRQPFSDAEFEKILPARQYQLGYQ